MDECIFFLKIILTLPLIFTLFAFAGALIEYGEFAAVMGMALIISILSIVFED